jgi:pimeloyl-ACP methyl ester carboxylesterase
MTIEKPRAAATIVLVHGAWADGSSWADVIGRLQSAGHKVMAAPIPLTSLSNDIAALEGTLERTDGPLVLAAHAYAGAVIGACTNERVRALVFVAALTPDEGETVGEVFYREKPHPSRLSVRPSPIMRPPSEPRSSRLRNVQSHSPASRKRLESQPGRQSPPGISLPRKIE